ncbi:MAG: TauD/TfdA family dioxygenase [Aquisalimonadaceae bacterium]
MTEAAPNRMPSGPVDNPGLWRGEDLVKHEDWIVHLTPGMVAEIEQALAAIKARGLTPPDFGRDDFPLPGCKDVLAQYLEELETGRGFMIIRGLPVERYSIEDAEIIFWGLGAHLGTALSQNSAGHLLGHVRNLDLDITNTNVRGYQTTVQLAYHNDQSDVIALMCLRAAKSGGQSSLVSVPALHNAMVERCPDLLEELYKPFYIDRRGEFGREEEGDSPYYALPVLSYHKGLITARYIRGYIMSAQRFPELPRLTEKQIAALDTFDALASSEGMALDFYMQPGDIQLVNNYCVFHSRTSFEDYPDLERRRHLLRLWLSTPNSRELPPSYKTRFGSCEPAAVRGGIPPRKADVEVPAERFELNRL